MFDFAIFPAILMILVITEKIMEEQLPIEIMKKAVKGISYISHPLRLRILEYLDVNGSSSVSTITKALGAEQVIVSQALKKMRDSHLVKTTRKGIFIYYDIMEEYPASIFVCLRKLYAYMTDCFFFLQDGVKALLPTDYTMMTANRMKLFAHIDKMRILEWLELKGAQNVTEIVNATGLEQMKVSQQLKKLRDDGFVSATRRGRHIIYEISDGVHKTCLRCIHKRYDSLKNKDEF